VSEHGYGIAIINESKYGYSIVGSTMSLSLLRSPTMPDPDCDQGRHEFSFAIYPHSGDYGSSKVYEVAYCYNEPLIRELILYHISGT
jgi:alpha-mannosidase